MHIFCKKLEMEKITYVRESTDTQYSITTMTENKVEQELQLYHHLDTATAGKPMGD